MASVFKAKGATKYTILYTDENGKRRKKAGATDKAVSQRIANDLENKVLLRTQGWLNRRAKAQDRFEVIRPADSFGRDRFTTEGDGVRAQTAC
jgi:hypothetical protein